MKMLLLMFAALSPVFGFAAVKTETVEYTDGKTVLEGYLAWDESLPGKRPGVVAVHEWTGLGDYVKGKVRQLAGMGYVAFAADIYGKGIRPQSPEEAGKVAGIFKNDRALTRSRISAALAQLLKNKNVDPKRVAAIGYCFGGMVVLELARSGATVAGVVTFHGSLDTPTPGEAKNIKAKVLALQGGDDPHVPVSARQAFEEEMRSGGVDWQMVVYGGAVHAFTNPAAGNDPAKGAAYNEKADRRSWEAMGRFFEEIFKP
jgi:dienelactone hydrolase